MNAINKCLTLAVVITKFNCNQAAAAVAATMNAYNYNDWNYYHLLWLALL